MNLTEKRKLVVLGRSVKNSVYRNAIARSTKLHRANLLNTIDYLEYGEKLLSHIHCVAAAKRIDDLYYKRLW